MADIFLSYVHEDQPRAPVIAARSSAPGTRCGGIGISEAAKYRV
jgi:hypothetical protein